MNDKTFHKHGVTRRGHALCNRVLPDRMHVKRSHNCSRYEVLRIVFELGQYRYSGDTCNYYMENGTQQLAIQVKPRAWMLIAFLWIQIPHCRACHGTSENCNRRLPSPTVSLMTLGTPYSPGNRTLALRCSVASRVEPIVTRDSKRH